MILLRIHEIAEKLIFTSNETWPYVFQRKTSSQERMTSATLNVLETTTHVLQRGLWCQLSILKDAIGGTINTKVQF